MILAAVVLLLLAIAYLPLRLRIIYKDKSLSVTAYVAGLPIHIGKGKKDKKQREDKTKAITKELKKNGGDTTSGLSAVDKFFCVLSAFYDASTRIRRALRVEKLDLKVRMSSGDAATTGFLVGVAYAEFYKLVAFLACLFTVEAPVAEFQPVFSDDVLLELTFDGIIRTNLAHSICAGTALYLSYRKQIKEIKTNK